jgi:hypothetical protein
LLSLELDAFWPIRPALTPTLSPQGVRTNARLSTDDEERGRYGAETSFSPEEKVAGVSRPDERSRLGHPA